MKQKSELITRSWPAPAKLNMFLHINGQRLDGYHDLQTLFQLLDWGDDLVINVSDCGNITRSGNVDGIPESGDLCIAAARLLKSRCSIQYGVHIELNKRIPLGAGLGGGSSDAATVLVALNELWHCGLSIQQLAEMGLELGADVPLFVYGNSARAHGRGEQLQSVTLEEHYFVLVFPEIHISTAQVFQHPLLKRDSPVLSWSDLDMKPGRNDCEALLLNLYPVLQDMMRDLLNWGQPRISGTGSTIFLTFDTKKSAISAASELKCRYNVRAVGGVNRSPLPDRLSIKG